MSDLVFNDSIFEFGVFGLWTLDSEMIMDMGRERKREKGKAGFSGQCLQP